MAANQRSYSPEDVETGLTYLAMAAGNAARASRKLGDDGHIVVPPRTLRHWALQVHSARYQEILADKQAKRREETAERLDDLTMQEIEAVQETLDRYRKELKAGKIPSKDLAASLRNLKVGLGIGNQNSALLRDRPAHVIEHRGLNVEQVAKLLAKYDVEGTAVELPGELPSESELLAEVARD